MSWKQKLKAKRLTITLLLILSISLAFNAYSLTTLMQTQTSGAFTIQLSANTHIIFQLDSETRMIFGAETDFQSYHAMNTLLITDENGAVGFYGNNSVLHFFWCGNVSNVELDNVAIANNTLHFLSDTHWYFLEWDWEAAYIVPPPTEFEVTVYGIMLDEDLAVENWLLTALNNAATFTVLTNSEVTDTYNTTAHFDVDGNNTYLVTFPQSYYLNETYNLKFLNITQITPDTTYSTTSNSFLFMPTSDMVFYVYYYLEPTTGFLLPVMFILGMVGLTGLMLAPLYAVYKIRKKEYLNGLVVCVVFGAVSFGLFIAWLWH